MTIAATVDAYVGVAHLVHTILCVGAVPATLAI